MNVFDLGMILRRIYVLEQKRGTQDGLSKAEVKELSELYAIQLCETVKTK